MTRTFALDRRAFLATGAAGIFSLTWSVPMPAKAAASAETGNAVGIWAVIHPDDTVVVRIARTEMGQGTMTGLAQLVADELDADWKHVRAEYVPPHENQANRRAWGDMSTGGSRGIRASVDYVRKGGAAARAMLIQAAAARWNVPAQDCTAAASVVTHKPTGRTCRYGELAAEAAALPVPADVTVKKPSEWVIIGRGVKRLDTAPKLAGQLKFAIDIQVPGMLNATVMQCPVFGGKLKSFDEKAALAMPGVRHVFAIDDQTVAVVADKFYQAKQALLAMPIEWDEGANAKVTSATIAAHLTEGLGANDAVTGMKQGDAKAALAKAARVVTADYATPFLNHATLEPMNATALYTKQSGGDIIEVWAPTQNGDATLAAAADAAGLPLSAVRVNKTILGGGFGRRGQQDYVRQAVLIAKQLPGIPVKMIWTREEDMRHGYYRPITMARMTGGLDEHGNLTSLHARISGQSILAYLAPNRPAGSIDMVQFQGWIASEFGYMAIPDILVDHAVRNTHVPVGFWRGVNTNQNTIYMECFIDELAHAAGRDPLDFRRAIMGKNPKHLAVLNAVAEKARWDSPLPKGVYRGICQNCGFGSYVAAVAEVSVSEKGELKILRIVAATDPGYAVNPDQIDAQVAGSFVYGLSALLTSENTVENGRIAEGNFDNYEVMRLAQMPKVETVIVPSGGFWGGVGEPTIAVAAPAVLNAIFAATGKRIRTMPLKHHDLSHA